MHKAVDTHFVKEYVGLVIHDELQDFLDEFKPQVVQLMPLLPMTPVDHLGVSPAYAIRLVELAQLVVGDVQPKSLLNEVLPIH